MEKKESKALPILALIFGIASLLTSCTVILGSLCGVASIILAIISLAKKKPALMPVVGLICSSFGIVISLIMIIAIKMGGVNFNFWIKPSSNLTTSINNESEQEEVKEDNFFKVENESTINNEEEKESVENSIINTNVEFGNNNISNDWKDAEFIFDGKKYKLFDKYSNLELAGWSFDMEKYGYDDSYILNSKQSTFTTISLEKNPYDAYVYIGLINDEDTVSTIKKCAIWSIDVDNAYADQPVEFTLAKGIKNGSTLAEVKAAYGEPSESYHSESLKYWTYTYDNDLEPQLRLTIYEDDSKGLTSFEYKHY